MPAPRVPPAPPTPPSSRAAGPTLIGSRIPAPRVTSNSIACAMLDGVGEDAFSITPTLVPVSPTKNLPSLDVFVYSGV